MWAYIFISPWLVGEILLFAWAIGRTILLSFQRVVNVSNLQSEWVGLTQYQKVFLRDVEFLPALLGTMRDMAINLPFILVFSLTVALLLARVRRGQTVLRAVFFLPVVIGSAGVVRELLNQGADVQAMASTMSPLRDALGSSTQTQGLIAPVEWVVGRLTLIIWHTGVQILLFVAGLNTIPRSLYEAASVDGATGWESFWKITLPMLSPVILVAAIYTIVDSFTDPLNSVVNYIMDLSIRVQLRLDYGAALGWVYFAVIFLLIALLLRLSSGLVFYMGGK